MHVSLWRHFLFDSLEPRIWGISDGGKRERGKYKEAIGFYEPIVKKHYDNILNVSAIMLANLCVSYIMTSQNEEAEELMRKIEKEEEQLSYDYPDKKI